MQTASFTADAPTNASLDAVRLNALGAKLGSTMLAMLIARHGVDAAARFAESVTSATLPGTPERIASDRAFDLLTARLGKLAGEG